MSSSIIFKQSYKRRTMPGAAGLNVRHLNYIATRPGAVYNKGCGFGLWGQLPGDGSIRIQTDLEQAKSIVREASANHTLYRAILSVGKEDAEQYGFYDRNKWEQLINDHVSFIAKQMDIKPQDFCWYAAMHYSKGHPHVHLLYWDNSSNPKQDFILKDEFKRRAEKIRAEFAGAIHREEIRELQKEQREPIADMRTMIRALCREANPERGINFSRLVTDQSLDPIAEQLMELVQKMPAKGSLRYAYLPPDYKLLVDALVDQCLKVPELNKELARYERLTREISHLYANGKDGTEDALQKATGKLRRELANEVMQTIRDLHKEFLVSVPEGLTQTDAIIREAVRTITPSLDSYDTLKNMLPAERIPVGKMADQIPGYSDQLNAVVSDMLDDARLRLPMQQNALADAGIHLEEKNTAQRRSYEKDGAEKYVLFGKEVTKDEWTGYRQAYRESIRALQKALTAQTREDAGWNRESVSTETAAILCGFARILSQAAYQQQAAAVQARINLKIRSKDKSREAKRDYWATQSFASEWGDGYN